MTAMALLNQAEQATTPISEARLYNSLITFIWLVGIIGYSAKWLAKQGVSSYCALALSVAARWQVMASRTH